MLTQQQHPTKEKNNRKKKVENIYVVFCLPPMFEHVKLYDRNYEKRKKEKVKREI